MCNHDNIQLLLDSRVGALLEERGVREDDLRQVLDRAEAEKEFHVQPATGHRLACLAPGKVTCWVEYGQEEEGFRIYTAYSHRMKILHGFNLPSKKQPEETGWVCAPCNAPLQLAVVKLAYLDETFAVDLPACPSCQRVLISEENAVAKMSLAERMLEDK